MRCQDIEKICVLYNPDIFDLILRKLKKIVVKFCFGFYCINISIFETFLLSVCPNPASLPASYHESKNRRSFQNGYYDFEE